MLHFFSEGVTFFFFIAATIPMHYVDWAAHLANSIYLLLNLFVSAMPCRVYHAIHTIALGFIYILFSVILQYAANIHAYPGVYMNDPQILVMSIFIGVILSMTVLWLFIYGLYRVRLAIAVCTTRRTPPTEQMASPLYILHPYIRQDYYY